MSDKQKKVLFVFMVISLIGGTSIIIYYYSFKLFLGISLLTWSNNIGNYLVKAREE